MKKKRILSAALALCMLFGSAAALPQGVFSESAGITASAEEEGDYVYAVKDDNTVMITKYKGSGGAITLPPKLGGKTVTEIGMNLFYTIRANKTVTSIVIPNTVKQIDDSAFYACQALTSITIPSSVTTIGKYAFRNCTALTSITIPSSVTTIYDSSFDGCTALKTINVDSANASYSSYDGVLYNKAKTQYICCPAGKTSINIPGTLATVPGTKLKAAITSVTLNEGTKTLEKWAFINCKDMKSLTIPQSVTTIGEHAVGFCHLSGDQTDPDTPISSFIIYGYKGSAAETYARSNGITFKEIGTACSHTYGTPAWSWSGYTSATATFTCTKCSNKQTVNATITNAVTKAATCAATGVRTYTAKAAFGGTSYTNTKTETIAVNANAHSWKTPTYSWSSDNISTAAGMTALGGWSSFGDLEMSGDPSTRAGALAQDDTLD
ncbi:MAG: leucine-rich repeat domain-containing protein [Ruminococcus sp.]|nr:leucine-rich repeat domain-containing protein [Ruminococcus sp.]